MVLLVSFALHSISVSDSVAGIDIDIAIAVAVAVAVAIASNDCRGCSESGRKRQGRRRRIGDCDGRCGSNGGSRPLDHSNGEKIFFDDRLAS